MYTYFIPGTRYLVPGTWYTIATPTHEKQFAAGKKGQKMAFLTQVLELGTLCSVGLWVGCINSIANGATSGSPVGPINSSCLSVSILFATHSDCRTHRETMLPFNLQLYYFTQNLLFTKFILVSKAVLLPSLENTQNQGTKRGKGKRRYSGETGKGVKARKTRPAPCFCSPLLLRRIECGPAACIHK